MTRARVLLIDPGKLYWLSKPSPISIPVKPGLLALYSFLRTHGAEEVSVLDLELEGIPPARRRRALAELEARYAALLSAEEYDVAAISCLTTYSYHAALLVARLSKRVRPDATVVVGGWHALSEAADFAGPGSPVDLVIRGPGEKSLLAIASHAPRRPEGVTRVVDGEALTREELTRFDYLLNDYVEVGARRYQAAFRDADAAILPTSRGCPHACRFCGNSLDDDRRWTPLEVDRCLSLVDQARRALPAMTACYLGDAVFGANRSWRRQMLGALERSHRDLPLVLITRVELIEPEDVELLSRLQALVVLGVESLSVEMLTIMRKTPHPERYVEQAREAVAELRAAAVPHELFFILDHPGETEESLTATATEIAGLAGPLTSVFGFRYMHFPQFARDYDEYRRRFGTEMRGPLRWWREPTFVDAAELSARYVPSKRAGETFEEAKTRMEGAIASVAELCGRHTRTKPHGDVIRQTTAAGDGEDQTPGAAR